MRSTKFKVHTRSIPHVQVRMYSSFVLCAHICILHVDKAIHVQYDVQMHAWFIDAVRGLHMQVHGKFACRYVL